VDDREVPGLEVDALGRVAEQDRERAADADERLLLAEILVPPSADVRRVAPEPRA